MYLNRQYSDKKYEDKYFIMPIKYIKRWEKVLFDQVIDVRSPLEFKEDNIPTSINLPVLTDKERKYIGTIYKQKNAFTAKKLGASLISKNIAIHIKKEFINKPGNWRPLIYCWRGGLRSKSIATVLSEIGWQVTILKGGYKTYRATVNKSINNLTKKKKFIVIKGATGCAKTKILHYLDKIGLPILDLEGLASHKGSLLGNIPNKPQPNQKLFESQIYEKLKLLNTNFPIFIESESSKIGNLYLPKSILNKIKKSPAIEISANIEARINFLLKDYKKYIQQENSFKNLFIHAKQKVSNDILKKWKKNFKNKNWYNLAFLLITEYYDPLYSHNLKLRDNKIIKSYNLDSINSKTLSELSINIKSVINISKY